MRERWCVRGGRGARLPWAAALASAFQTTAGFLFTITPRAWNLTLYLGGLEPGTWNLGTSAQSPPPHHATRSFAPLDAMSASLVLSSRSNIFERFLRPWNLEPWNLTPYLRGLEPWNLAPFLVSLEPGTWNHADKNLQNQHLTSTDRSPLSCLLYTSPSPRDS